MDNYKKVLFNEPKVREFLPVYIKERLNLLHSNIVNTNTIEELNFLKGQIRELNNLSAQIMGK